MKDEEFYESHGFVFGDMTQWVKEKAGVEYVYKKVADLIQAGKDPEEAQAEVLSEMKAMSDGLVFSDSDVTVQAEEGK